MKNVLHWIKKGEEVNSAIRSKIGKNRMVGKDIVPTLDSDRDMTPAGFAWTWAGMSIILTGFMLPAQMYPALTGWSIILAFILGCATVVVVLALTGDIGITYGIPFSVYLRTIFGTIGTYIPSIIRAFPAMFWYGFQTWLGASAINEVIKGWLGFDNLWIWVFVFAAIQIYITAQGVKAIAIFETLVTPLILIVFVIMLVLAKINFNVNIIQALGLGGEGGMPFIMAMNAVIGYWATMALNIPDFTRSLKADKYEENWFKRNKGSIFAQAAGLIPTMTFVALVGYVLAIATGEWHPVDQVMKIGGGYGFLVVLVLVAIALAQWTTNIGANILPPAFIFANVGAPVVTFKIGCIICGVVGLLLQPWKFASHLVNIFAIISALLGAVAGIMICDYYLIRKRKINIEALYDQHSYYSYWKGYNPAAYIAFVVGCILGMWWLEGSYFIAIAGALAVYYVLMKVWVLKKYPQEEVE